MIGDHLGRASVCPSPLTSVGTPPPPPPGGEGDLDVAALHPDGPGGLGRRHRALDGRHPRRERGQPPSMCSTRPSPGFSVHSANIDEAFVYFGRAMDERESLLGFAYLPPFDPLRSDPRFQALLRRMNFPGTATIAQALKSRSIRATRRSQTAPRRPP